MAYVVTLPPQHHHIINPLQLSGVAYTEQD
jgi:hypothetical protein